jgi:hypothetical protein
VKRRELPRDSSESYESGVVIPVRWPQDEAERAALRSANGVDLAQERATAAVVGLALTLLLLIVVRLVVE